MLNKLNNLIEMAKQKSKKRIVVVNANDDYVINAINEVLKIGIIEPILIGDKDKIHETLTSLNCSINNYQIIDVRNDQEAAFKAVELIRTNQADILMKGLIETKTILKEVVNKETGIKDSNLLSHVGVISYPDMDRVLLVSDAAMVVNPTIEQKIDIIYNAVKLAKKLNYTKPLIGLVSSVEKVNERIVSSIDAKEIVEKLNAKNIEDFIVDGPFAIDNLVSMDSVKHKGIKSEVAGKADILIFPNIDGGNIFYKTSVFLGKAESAGIIIGAKCPIVLTSRADSIQSKIYSIALSIVYSS